MNIRHVTFAAVCILLAACGVIPSHLEPPVLTVAGITDVHMGLLEQRLVLNLHVTNPNDSALQLDGLTLTIALDGNHLADATTTAATVLPALGQVELPLHVVVSTNDLLKVVQDIHERQQSRVDYRLTGEAIVAPFSRHVKIDRSGTLAVPASLLK